MLPNDFPVSELNQYSLLSFLKTVFDYKLTVKENIEIGKNLASVEYLNNQVQLIQNKKAYVRLTANSVCGVCKTRLDLK